MILPIYSYEPRLGNRIDPNKIRLSHLKETIRQRFPNTNFAGHSFFQEQALHYQRLDGYSRFAQTGRNDWPGSESVQSLIASVSQDPQLCQILHMKYVPRGIVSVEKDYHAVCGIADVLDHLADTGADCSGLNWLQFVVPEQVRRRIF